MTADYTPDNGHGGEVVDFPAARAARPAATGGATLDGIVIPPPAPPAGDGDPALEGTVIPVDSPGAGPRDWLADLHAAHATRRPIVPPAFRSRSAIRATARFLAAHYGHVVLYHLTRAPKYGAKLAARSPRGAGRFARGAVRWTFDLDGQAVRRAAVLRGDAETYLKLARHRDGRVGGRLIVAGIGTVLALAAGITVAVVVPPLGQWAILAGAVAALGAAGRPGDAPPILDRAVIPARVEKLTSDIVCRALAGTGIAPLASAITKNPRTAIGFVSPIARDGSAGWRADLDLPYGVTVAEVMDRRDKLASGLRRPVGCVWPEVDHAQHPGRMVLFVGDQDMSKARQPAWPLARHGTADLFRGAAFATDQRGRTVAVTLMFVSVIIGAIPRMGKTFLLRLLLLIAALDPRAEVHAYDFKGTGDLAPLEAVAHRYRAGDDDEDMAYALADFRALRDEMRRRTKVIRSLPRDVCPESKVTPELAGNKSLGLHPVVIAADECQVMFEHKAHGEEFEEICTDLTKRGPALGMTLILATQRPDAKSIPTGISANAVLRMCLKVMGQVENDMVLGTSAYKNGTRATMFSFSDKGICYFAGEGDAPRIVRSFYIDAPTAERIALRARGIRQAAGLLSGHAAGEVPGDIAGPSFDLLEDIAAVVHEPKMWSETVVARLAELRPGVYGPWAELEPAGRAEQLTTALKPYGVRTGQVWGTTGDGRGANRRGITRDDITEALTERNQKRGPGGPR